MSESPSLCPPSAESIPGLRRLEAMLRLLRPRQWTKNLACFIPLFCSGRWVGIEAYAGAILAFLAFCAGASCVYVINDLRDAARDRIHPLKRWRPLAAGTVGRWEAVLLAMSLFLLSAVLAWWASPPVLVILTAYVVLNLCYSLGLKQVAVLDVMMISAGFILRLAAGGEAAGVMISAWLALCAFFLSMFLAFGKRRAELNGPDAERSRGVLSQYTVLMLDRFSNISATLAIASYAVFTVVSRADHALLLTCPPVVFGLFRYVLLIETKHAGESPELLLLKDAPIQVAIVLWLTTYAAVLYFGLRISVL